MAVKAHFMGVARDPATGAALLSATVNVYTPGTVTPIGATIYDKSGNVLSNPLTSDASTGLIDFYLTVAQEVDLSIAKAGYTTRTYSNVPVLDDATFELSSLMTTTGDMVYASSANTPSRLAAGATGALLNVSGGVPRWGNTLDAGGLTITAGGLTVTAGNVGIGGAPVSWVGLDTASLTITASAALAFGARLSPTLSAAANNDGLEALRVNPGIAANSKTGLTFSGVHIGSIAQTPGIATHYGLVLDSVLGGVTNNYGVYASAPSGGSGDNFGGVFGGDVAVGNGSQATNATVGFLYINGGAGAPTGVPARFGAGVGNGKVPMYYDSTNNKIYFYNGAWRGVLVA